MNDLRKAIVEGLMLELPISHKVDAILSAFEAALPEPKQLKYITDGDATLTKEGKQRFFRYGGYDFAINEVKLIIHQAKEKS